MFTAAIIVVLMALGLPVNATAILPMTGTFFLCFLFYSERAYQLTSVRRLVPGTLECNFNNNVLALIETFLSGKTSLPDTNKAMERLLVLYVYEKFDGNVYRSSKEFGIRRFSG